MILLSVDLFAQINSDKYWPTSIQREFDKCVKEQKMDTLLVYYSYLGPWTNLPDSCKGISSFWILWIKDNCFYTKQLRCDSIKTGNIQSISSRPFDYLITHKKDFKLRDQYFKTNRFLPPISTDGSWQYLSFMTSKNKIFFNLSEHQRNDTIWNQFHWIKPTIELIDLTVNELYENKNRH